MRRTKKAVVIAIAAVALMVGGITVASSKIESKAVSVRVEGAQKFKGNWEYCKNYDGGKATLRYGFNSVAIDEDYARAFHTTKKHYAYVKNGNGSHNGISALAGFTSYIDVPHSGNSICYGNSY